MEQTFLLMDSLRCEQLWRRHADRLLLYAATVLSDRSAAEDVLQNVFVRLMASPPEDIDSEAGYLFRAVRNEALNSIRSRRLAARAFSPLFDDAAEDPRESVELKERGRQVEQVLLRLEPEEREAVVLNHHVPLLTVTERITERIGHGDRVEQRGHVIAPQNCQRGKRVRCMRADGKELLLALGV